MRHQDGLLALNEQKNSKFWANVERSDLFGCWEWTGPICHGNGYGCHGAKKTYAHRTAYQLSGGRIPEGAILLHRCNNKRCTNPLHLYAGDHLQNMADAKRAGALTGSKLTPAKARDIVRLHQDGWTYPRLSKKFGITPQNVGRVCRGETWSKATGIKPKPKKAAKPALTH